MPDSSSNSPASAPGFPRYDSPLERRTLRDYYVIVREHLWLALAVALLVTAPLAFQSARQPRIYASTATLQFQRPERVVTSDPIADTSIRTDAELKTYLLLLESTKLRMRLVESFSAAEVTLLQKPYLANLGPGVQPPAPGALISDVTIDWVRNSLIVTITARARSPEAAALIANRYVEEFIDFLAERSSGGNEAAVDFLQRRSEELRKEYEEAEHRLQDYKQRENLISLDDSLNLVNERLKSINTAINTTRIERLDLEVYQTQQTQFRKDGRNLFEIAYIANHGAVPTLKAKLDELLSTESVLAKRYLERHPKMIALAQQITSVRSQLDQAVDLAVADLDSRLAKTRSNEQSLAAELVTATQEAQRLGKLSVEFKSLVDQALVKRTNYVTILDRLNQARTTRNLENLPVRTLDHGLPNPRPVAPDLWRITRNCTLLFFAILILLPVVLNFIDDRIKSSWDVEQFIGVHLLGIIPDLAEVRPEERPTLVNRRETTPAVESFLSLYSAVKLQSKLDFPKSLIVTSTIPGEGKTLISCNLAAAFARHGKNVLLIDCDLRRPMLHRHFDLPNNQGLLQWAENGYYLADDPLADQNLGITRLGENFHLLRAGGRSKAPTAILEHAAFGDLLEALKRRFDLLIIDTPPVGAVTDAILVAERTDEVVYVCRFNKAQRKHIRVYIKNLRETKNDLLGIVLNGMNPRRIEHYSDYRYYRSYKKYYGAHS